MNPTVGYVRVSREEQARGDRSSLAQQQQAIEQLADRLHLPLPTERFVDPGVSGGTAEDRPGFMALLRHCEQHPQTRRSPGYVLVLNDSRWGRFEKPAEAAYWRVVFEKHHGWIIRFAEADDTADPMASEMLRTIHSVQASAYREQIRRNAKRGARGTAAQGFWQNEAPIGYRRLATEPSRGQRVLDVGQRKADTERVRLTPGPDQEVQVVRWMFQTYAAGGISLGQMARELRDRFPARRWSRPTVQAVLKNPSYLGDVVWCRRPHDKLERQDTPVRSRDQWVVVPDAHPPIVDRELFEQVRLRLLENKQVLRRRKVEYLLSGMIRCTHCGEPYMGAGGPVGPEADPDRYRFYRDRNYEQCRNPVGIIPRRLLEPWVVEMIGRVVAHPSTLKMARAEFSHLLDLAQASVMAQRMDGGQDKARLAAERERLVAAIASGTLTESEAAPRLANIRQQLEAISSKVERARFAERRLGQFALDREQLLEQASDFRGTLERLSGMQRREFVARWLDGGTMDKANGTVRIRIRKVPALGLFSLVDGTPGRAGHQHKPGLIVTRQLQLPPAVCRPRRRQA